MLFFIFEKKKKQKTAFSAEKNLFLALNKSQIFGYLFCLISFKKIGNFNFLLF